METFFDRVGRNMMLAGDDQADARESIALDLGGRHRPGFRPQALSDGPGGRGRY